MSIWNPTDGALLARLFAGLGARFFYGLRPTSKSLFGLYGVVKARRNAAAARASASGETEQGEKRRHLPHVLR